MRRIILACALAAATVAALAGPVKAQGGPNVTVANVQAIATAIAQALNSGGAP
jgi:hypothetical protein